MNPITFSIAAGEEVNRGVPIYIRCSEAVTSAQNAITLLQEGKQAEVIVSLEENHKVIKVPTDDLPLGRYSLMVGELLKKDTQRRLTNYTLAIEFILNSRSPWRATLDPALKVLHVTDLLLSEDGTTKFIPGEKIPVGCHHIARVKAIDTKTSVIHDLTFEHDKKIDLQAIVTRIYDGLYEEHGRIHEMLRRHLNNETPHDPLKKDVNVVVWAHIMGLPTYDKDKETPSPEYNNALLGILDSRKNIEARIKALGGEVTLAPENMPFVHAKIPTAKVEELGKSQHVGGVFYDDPTATPDLGNSIAISGSDVVMRQGHTAEDVRIAVYEAGPSNTKNLEFAGQYSKTPADSNHARLTCAIVKNVESDKPAGHARHCSLYSANSFDTKALLWAVDPKQRCTVINQTFHRASGPVSGFLQADDVLKDYLTRTFPFPTIVQAAGNYYAGDGTGVEPPYDEYVNHKGYNTLTVGNHDDSAIVMAGDSTFRNPITFNCDRELPELAANGTAVAANEQLLSGTSMSASAVAGVVGLIQGVHCELKKFPEACRAILLASAKRDLAIGTWWGDVVVGVDAKCGAGALDAHAATLIAYNRIKPAQHSHMVSGWGAEPVEASKDHEGVKARYKIKVPFAPASSSAAAPAAYLVKAAIAWNSTVKSEMKRPIRSVLELDLDLVVRDEKTAIVAYSVSLDNSYEVVEFYAAPGAKYTLEVVHTSGKGSTYVGTAWTVRRLEGLERRQ